MIESIPSKLKQLSILKIYNELSGKREKQFNRQFTKQPDLQKYVSDLQQILQDLPHISELTPSPDMLSTQRQIFEESVQNTTTSKANRLFMRTKKPIRRRQLQSGNWGSRIAVISFLIITLGIIIPLVVTKNVPIDTLMNKSTEYQIRSLIDQKDINPENIKYSKSSLNQISFLIETEKELTYTGDYKNQLVKDLICYLLINSQNPGKRLQSIKHLKEIKPDIKITNALITTLLSDPNQGIRLKAIRILNTHPVDDTINQACMKVLLEDQNNTVRMEALKILSQDPGEDLLPILQVVSSLDDNEYIRNEAAQIMENIIEAS